MLYAIIGHDVKDSLDKRALSRPDHVERLNNLKSQGRLVLAGPFPILDSEDPGPAGYSGSLIVAEFASLHEATTWANADPYLKSGVYKSVDVKPFRKVLP